MDFPLRRLPLFLVGSGKVGRELLAQIAAQARNLRVKRRISLELVGLANTRRMLLCAEGIDPALWETGLRDEGEPADLAAFAARMLGLPAAVCCDCTAGEELPDLYEKILRAGIGVVTCNKRCNSGESGRHSAVNDYARQSGVPYLYETAVGAALPIIGPIADLVATGDRILSIKAVLSGTLGFMFNAFAKGLRFSALLREAQSRGYTEPDPREDLAARDAARKCVILAREAGFDLGLEDVKIESLLDEASMAAPDAESFFAALEKRDAHFETLRSRAESEGSKLRYVATIDHDGARMSLCRCLPGDPFFSLEGTDNMVVITSGRYDARPLVVSGAGAGPRLTAGGVFADILRAFRESAG